MIKELISRGYDSDAVKTWKKSLVSSDDDNEGQESEDGPDYNYLLSMPLWNLTKEKKELLKNRDREVKSCLKLFLKLVHLIIGGGARYIA